MTVTYEFRYNEERQVQVTNLGPGINFLPVVPYVRGGTPHGVTRVENGTIIRFIENFQDSGNPEDKAWVFALTKAPDIMFLVSSSCISYLWKFSFKHQSKLR